MHDYLIAAFGGALIGLSASGMLFALGRVTGISGILAGSLFPRKDDASWRYMFLSGLLVGGLLLIYINNFQFEPITDRSMPAIAFGGLLVGLGTNIGNGCTSGHGVCGISRLSVRSIVATLAFMASGIVTTYVVQHILGGL